MNAIPSTSDRQCAYCGKPLKALDVTLFGKPERVFCFGSCGCERSSKYVDERVLNPSDHRCPICRGSMMVDSFPGYVSECPYCGYACVFESDLAMHMEGIRAHRAQVDGILSGTGVPKLYWNVTPDRAVARRIMESGKGLYICGGNGTAKTLMAASVAKAYAEDGKTVRFVSSVQMLADFKDTYGNGRSEAEVFSELNGCDLLVIDDLGKENPTSWASTMLYSVIDGRYGSMKPVVVTTNYAEQELVDRMGRSYDDSTARAMMSRLIEMTEKVVMDGPDRRLS